MNKIATQASPTDLVTARNELIKLVRTKKANHIAYMKEIDEAIEKLKVARREAMQQVAECDARLKKLRVSHH